MFYASVQQLGLVAEMLQCGKDTWWHYSGDWAALQTKWMEQDRTIQVESELLQELTDLGVISCRPTLFGDMEYSVQDGAYVWQQASALGAGRNSLALYDPESAVKDQNKLG